MSSPATTPGAVKRPDLTEARRLFDAGYKLVPLVHESKRPAGNAWNLNPVTAFNPSVTGYGALLKDNGLCSLDPDNVEPARLGLVALGFKLDALMSAGVQTISTRPGSGGRSTFRDPGSLRWIKFSTRTHGTILELRAASANLQDVVPGLVYRDSEGELRTQSYANGRGLDDAPELPADLLAWWRRASSDVEFLRSEQRKFYATLGVEGDLAISAGNKLAFPSSQRRRFNAQHEVGEILRRHGYEEHGKGRWSPPTATGAAGVRPIPGKDGLWQSDHASDPLHGTFDAWSAFVVLDHEQDVRAAERAFLAQSPEFERVDDAGGEPEPKVTEESRVEIDFDARCLDLTDLDQEPEVVPETIAGLVFQGMVNGLAGPGKVGKSQLALSMGVAVALGWSWRGLDVIEGPVVYLSAEDHPTVLRNRLKAMLAFDRAAAEQDTSYPRFDPAVFRRIAERLVVPDMHGEGFSLTRNERGRTHVNEAHVEALVRWLEGRFPGEHPFVIYDTIGRYDEGDESNASYKLLVRALEAAQKESGCTQLVLAHNSQQATLEKRVDLTALRGGLHLGNSVRSLMVLVGHKLGVRDEALEAQGVVPPMESDLQREFQGRAALLQNLPGSPSAALGARLGERLSVLVHSDSNVAPTRAPLWFVRGSYNRAGIMLPFDFTPDLAARKEEREERREQAKEAARERRLTQDGEAVLELVGRLQDDPKVYLTRTVITGTGKKRRDAREEKPLLPFNKDRAKAALDELVEQERLEVVEREDTRPRRSGTVEVYRVRSQSEPTRVAAPGEDSVDWGDGK